MQNKIGLKNLLIKHYNQYPQAQLKDMVKFIYQHEFGSGHLVTDETASLKRLQEEYLALKEHSYDRKSSAAIFEEIGNGLCRLNLSKLQDTGLNLTTVNRFFLNTAKMTRGSMESFEKKLEVLKECCRDGILPYAIKELKAYLQDYQSQGYPPVRHSEEFRQAYSPAYRVVKTEYRDFFKLFCKIDVLMKAKNRTFAAIDGNSGAGKTNLAALLREIYDANIFHMDDFFLTPELRTEERLKEVGGNVDYLRFKEEVIGGLESGEEFYYRRYDCHKQAFVERVRVVPKPVNIIEGVYSMHPTLIDYYDLKVFLGIDSEEQGKRILQRNGAIMYQRFLVEWIPMENRYFEEMNIEEQADLIFKNNEL